MGLTVTAYILSGTSQPIGDPAIQPGGGRADDPSKLVCGIGGQAVGNLDGILGGPTFGIPGGSVTATYSWCKEF